MSLKRMRYQPDISHINYTLLAYNLKSKTQLNLQLELADGPTENIALFEEKKLI